MPFYYTLPDKGRKRLGDDLDKQYEIYTRASAEQIATSHRASQQQREDTRKTREEAIGFLAMQKQSFSGQLQALDGSWSRGTETAGDNGIGYHNNNHGDNHNGIVAGNGIGRSAVKQENRMHGGSEYEGSEGAEKGVLNWRVQVQETDVVY